MERNVEIHLNQHIMYIHMQKAVFIVSLIFILLPPKYQFTEFIECLYTDFKHVDLQ